jgi:SAM-dependent methyltransferase
VLRRVAAAKVALSKRLTREGIDAFLRHELSGTVGTVLDLGAGLRPFANLLPGRTVALDHRARPALDVVGDAHRLPFADGAFDAVVCTEVFEHLLDPPAAAGEMIRVLKPGGRLVLTTRFCFPLHERPADFWRFTPYTLRRLFAPLNPTVVPQHTAYRTLLVQLVRLVMEPTPRNRLVSPPVLTLCALLWPLDPLMRALLPSDSLSSGYLVAGRKAGTSAVGSVDGGIGDAGERNARNRRSATRERPDPGARFV